MEMTLTIVVVGVAGAVEVVSGQTIAQCSRRPRRATSSRVDIFVAIAISIESFLSMVVWGCEYCSV